MKSSPSGQWAQRELESTSIQQTGTIPVPPRWWQRRPDGGCSFHHAPLGTPYLQRTGSNSIATQQPHRALHTCQGILTGDPELVPGRIRQWFPFSWKLRITDSGSKHNKKISQFQKGQYQHGNGRDIRPVLYFKTHDHKIMLEGPIISMAKATEREYKGKIN